MSKLTEMLEGISTVAIAGHVNPDGDCVGSCMGLYLYLKDNYPDIQADVYLEEPAEIFHFIRNIEDVKTECETGRVYDLLFLLDVSSMDRVGVAMPLYEFALHTVGIDHHITNKGLCELNQIFPEASSTCEVLYGLMEDIKISEACAEALYTGIVHDTGVFQYSCTSPLTMRVAANLMEKGIPFSKIVDRSFYQKSYAQNQIMGRTLMESIMLLNGQCIIGIVRRKEMEFYGLSTKDLDGIVSQLKNTAGVEVALFLYEKNLQEFKVSMRSRERVDVSKIAELFGGGGHVRAAGCTMHGTAFDVVNSISVQMEKQLTEEV